MSLSLIILLILAALAAYGVYLYNSLVGLQVLVAEAWSGISIQLKKRHELVPNLVEVVKGYSAHESDTLRSVAQARAATGKEDIKESEQSEARLTADLRQLFALAEQYPDLKASESYQTLHAALVAVENDIQHARRYYNGAVRNFNTAQQTIPSNIIASLGGFSLSTFFELDAAIEEDVPHVMMSA